MLLTNRAVMPEIDYDYSRYRVAHDNSFRLSDLDPSDDQGMDEETADVLFERNTKELDELQERLYAEAKQSLLIVLQAMDAGGKDSTIRKVTRELNPQGVRVWSFKKPSLEERDHDFLWRVHAHVPRKGIITLFNRSHYEDVLIVRVHHLAPAKLIEQRYEHINDFERMLHDHGTRIVKIMLHISKAYQAERLRRRLERSDKHWKFNPADLDERAMWDDYMAAFERLLNNCSTPWAPWYVIPAETRWFRDLLVSQILVDTLTEMDPQYPAPTFDPSAYPPDSIT